jgi:hypothetical protein
LQSKHNTLTLQGANTPQHNLATNVTISINLLFKSQSQSHTPHNKKKKIRHKTTLALEQHLYYMEESSFCHIVLHTHLFKDYVTINVNLDNYDGFIGHMEHI